MIVQAGGSLGDGASLTVGNDTAAFAPTVPDGGDMESGGGFAVIQSGADDSAASAADDGPPSELIAVQAAAYAAAQAAATAHAQAARALMQQRIDAFENVAAAIENSIDPGNQTHSRDVELAACLIVGDGLLTAIANNGGTRAGLSDSALADSIMQSLQTYRASAALAAGGTAANAMTSVSDNTAADGRISDLLMDYFAACDATIAG